MTFRRVLGGGKRRTGSGIRPSSTRTIDHPWYSPHRRRHPQRLRRDLLLREAPIAHWVLAGGKPVMAGGTRRCRGQLGPM